MNCREHYLRLGSNGRVQICKSIRPASMCKSIFSATRLPGSNSISTTHIATKLGRQGCRRKTETRRPDDRVDHNDPNHNNTFGNSLHDILKSVAMYPHYQGYASPCTHSVRYSEAPRVRIFL